MTDPSQPPPLPPPLPPTDPSNPVPIAPLAYGGRPPLITTRPVGSAALRFLAGLGAGAAVSLIIWGLGWNALEGNSNGFTAIFIVPGLKLLAAVVCMFFRGWRAFGAGLLVSIGVGAMIFFGSCMYHYKP